MYLALKAIHVLAVAVFLGNITVGVFWKAFADRSGDASKMAFAMRGIIAADKIFTIPAIVVLVLAGIATAIVGNIPFLSTGWLLWAIVLFIIAGIVFAPLSRVQREIAACAETGLGTEEQRTRYKKLDGKWTIYGIIALLLPIIALFLMVLKPALPAF